MDGSVLTLDNEGGSVTLPVSGIGSYNWGTQVVKTNPTLTGQGTDTSPLGITQGELQPDWAKVQNKPAGFSNNVDNVEDADNSITNEIQKLTLDGSVLTLDNGDGSVTLPLSGTGGDNWGSQAVLTDATLTGNGTGISPLKIADNGITSAKIQDNGIVTADLADHTVSTAKLGDLAVNSDKIQNDAVTADKLMNNAVTSDKINSGAVTGTKIAQSGAMAGQALKWNETIWAPADDATGSAMITLPWSGNASSGIDNYAFTVISSGQETGAISGRQTNTTAGSGGCGVYGESLSPYGSGVHAYSSGTNGRGLYANAYIAVRAVGNYRGVDANGDKAVEGRSYSNTGFGVGGYSPVCGVYGESWNSGGKGVYGKSDGDSFWDVTIGVYGEATTEEAYGVKGYASDTIGVNYGVYGESNSKNGYGIRGMAKKSGVYGKSTGFQGIAVKGEALGDNSIGISGKAVNPNSTGVYGEGTKQGIYGLSNVSQGTGIYGKVTGYKGDGLIGEATGTNSIGVQGIAINSTSTGIWGEGSNQGVYGISEKTTGKGINGYASSTTGTNYGVYGESASSTDTGAYGKAPLYGVYGISSAANSYGVYGKSTSGTGYGVHGEAQKIGVYGLASSATGSGVYGEAPKYGVYGFSTASSGYGVYGISSASSGYGLYGESPQYVTYAKSTGNTGRALKAEATGTGSIGVWGVALGDNSTGIYAQGENYDFYAVGPGVNYGEASSIRWKNNIESIPDPIEKIKAIRGVYFDWDQEHGGQHDVGMIAEEVGKVLPEIVVYEENGVDASGMDYSKIAPLLVEAVKALKFENEKLNERLEKLEKIVGERAEE